MNGSPRLPGVWRDALSLDLRSIAAFRALLGIALTYITLAHLLDLSALHTDSGMLPRRLIVDGSSRWQVSLHLANGTAPFAALLLGLQLLAAAALTVGWHTRAAAGSCWLLLASLGARLPTAVTPGEQLASALLFFALFVPLGARWSADAAELASPPAPMHHSAGARALLLQALAVPAFGALSAWWTSPAPNALASVLALDAVTTDAGRWLAEHGADGALQLGCSLALIGAFLALCPSRRGRTRGAAVLLLLPLPVATFVLLNMGSLSWVMLAMLALLLPGSFWEALQARIAARRPPGRLRLYYDRDRPGVVRRLQRARELLLLTDAELLPAQEHARARALLRGNMHWLVIDHDDAAARGWPAALVLMRRSPLFGSLGRLLSQPALERRAAACYGWVGAWTAAHGHRPARREREHRMQPDALAQALATAAIIAVLLLNLAGVGGLPRSLAGILRGPLSMLRLDVQAPDYAGAPIAADGWLVAVAELADGSSRDLLRPDAPEVDYGRRAAAERRAVGRRIWLIERHLWTSGDEADRSAYAAYLCRRWNEAAQAHPPAARLRLVWMLEAGAPAPLEQQIIWRGDCPANRSNAGEKA